MPEAVDSAAPDATTPTPPALGANGVAATWPEQNRRRLALIRQRRAAGLDPAEQAEFERLQAMAEAVVDAGLPPPLFTPEERAYLDAKAAGR